MDIRFTLLLRRYRDMNGDLTIAYLSTICGAYLIYRCIDILGDYRKEKKVLEILDRIERKIDQLPPGRE
jgi:hypothetical protein